MSTTTEARTARYATLDGRSAKALALACSTDNSHPLLQWARTRPDGTMEATTGHILTRMQPRVEDEKGSHIPQDSRENIPEWYIHRDDLKRPGVSQSLRLDLESGELVVLDKYGEPEIAIPGGASTPEDEGTFPDTDRVYNVHMRPECIRFRVSYDYLATLVKMAKASHGRKDGGIILEVPEDIEAQTSNGSRGAVQGIRYLAGDTEGLLMPLRMD